ncbi:hypothetical protein ES703_82710 [subsurface metagenome]
MNRYNPKHILKHISQNPITRCNRGGGWHDDNDNGGQPDKPQRLWIGEYGESRIFNLPPGANSLNQDSWGNH